MFGDSLCRNGMSATVRPLRKNLNMGILKLLSSLLRGSGRSVTRAAGNSAYRTYAKFPKRANPLSRRSLGNTSRYRRF
jgi:hypothetical protein